MGQNNAPQAGGINDFFLVDPGFAGLQDEFVVTMGRLGLFRQEELTVLLADYFAAVSPQHTALGIVDQNQPVLLLREANGDRYLPIWIGQSDAAAIALEQQGVEPARPLTHDLIRDLIAALGHSLKEVRIVDLQEGTFYADLIFDRDIKVSARPSDSVAIALRVGVPIYVEEAVLAEAGLLIPDENDDEAAGAVREDEVEKFKEFLDSVSPDDFKAT